MHESLLAVVQALGFFAELSVQVRIAPPCRQQVRLDAQGAEIVTRVELPPQILLPPGVDVQLRQHFG